MPIPIAKGRSFRMSRKQRRSLSFVLGVCLALMVWHINRSTSRVYVVSDILFFVSIGLLVAGAAGIVDNTGLFDIVVFSVRQVAALITNKHPLDEESRLTFPQYARRKREKNDVRLLLIAGCFCFLASLLAAAHSL